MSFQGLSAERLFELGGLKRVCSEELRCAAHGLAVPCDLCDLEDVSTQGVVCESCGHHFEQGLVVADGRGCQSAVQFARFGRIAFESEVAGALERTAAARTRKHTDPTVADGGFRGIVRSEQELRAPPRSVGQLALTVSKFAEGALNYRFTDLSASVDASGDVRVNGRLVANGGWARRNGLHLKIIVYGEDEATAGRAVVHWEQVGVERSFDQSVKCFTSAARPMRVVLFPKYSPD